MFAPRRNSDDVCRSRAGCRLALIALASSLLLAPLAFGQTVPNVNWTKFGGLPRPWQDGVSPFAGAAVNMVNGNLLYELPLVAWSGRGPAVAISLFHNSLAPSSGLSAPPGCGFSLGKGWRMSFCGQIVPFETPTETTRNVIEDSGACNIYTYNATTDTWDAPPGVYDQLIEEQAGTWLVLRKDQSYRRFDADGRLSTVGDASGNELTLHYDDSEGITRIAWIRDAAGRFLDFIYDVPTARLTQITDPAGRSWLFGYDAAGNVNSVNYPEPAGQQQLGPITFTHGAANRLTRVYDFAGRFHEIQYSNSRPSVVRDPLVTGESAPFEQTFALTWTCCMGCTDTTNSYTDRRGKTWSWNVTCPIVPQSVVQERTNPLNQVDNFEFDLQLNLVEYTNDLGHSWDYAYDATGNLLSAVDPLVNEWLLAYDEPGRSTGAFNNLTRVIDPLGNEVLLHYLDANNPTAVTQIDEPPVEPEGPMARTLIAWYFNDADHCGSYTSDDWNGLLKTVTDPNGVTTRFEYDGYGQTRALFEGNVAACGQSPPVNCDQTCLPVQEEESRDEVGRLTVECGLLRYGGHGHHSICLCTHFDELGRPVGYGIDILGPCVQPPDPPLPPDIPEVPELPEPPPSVVVSYPSPDGNGVDTGVNVGRDYSTICSPTPRQRNFTVEFDEMYRLKSTSIEFDENKVCQPIERTFTFTTDPDGRPLARTGPDGVQTIYDYDDLGRIEHVEQGSGAEFMSADMYYNAVGNIATIAYGNNTRTRYLYDNAERLTDILHERLEQAGWANLLSLHYTLDAAGRIVQIDETDCSANPPNSTDPCESAVTVFGYDTRHRLVHEHRTGSPGAYEYAYSYDDGGNRLTKTKYHPVYRLIEEHHVYHYDVQDPAYYGQFNNRLMAVEEFDASLELIKRTDYAYWLDGNVRYIVTTNDPATNVRDAIGFVYNAAGQVWIAVKDRWEVDAENQIVPASFERLAASEYLYDGIGIARHTVRGFDPTVSGADPNEPGTWGLTAEVLRDDGSSGHYADYSVGTGQPQLSRRTFEGFGHYRIDSASPDYAFNSFNGSFALSTSNGAIRTARYVHTAFGEELFRVEVGAAIPRFNYFGLYGYEGRGTHGPNGMDVVTDAGLYHAGHRYVHSHLGRFVQRDPTGIRGGMNVYEFVGSSPTWLADPYGTDRYYVRTGNHSEVWFDRGNGRYYAYDFGPAGGKKKKGLKGIVVTGGQINEQPMGPGTLPDGAQRFPSSPEQDAEDRARILNQQKNPPYFAITGAGPAHNCMGWAWFWATNRQSKIPFVPGTYCFVADTTVLGLQGPTAIGELTAGDLVVCANLPGQPSVGLSVVAQVFSAQASELVAIEIDNEIIRCTEEHRFWTRQKGWVCAGELTTTDILVDVEGCDGAITAVRRELVYPATEVVNITVPGESTYYVGRRGVLVHNKPP